MRREPLIHAAVLLGALLALTLSSYGSPTPYAALPQETTGLQQKPKAAAHLSDEQWGDLYMARKEYDNAIGSYSHVIQNRQVLQLSDAKVAILWNKMGICYQQKMDYQNARKAYKKAIRLDRTFAQPWNNLGTSYYLAQRPKKSIKFYRRAIRMSPDSASFHFNLGTAYFARKKYEQATHEYRIAIQMDPEILTRTASARGTSVETRYADAKFYFYLAKIFASVGSPDKAVKYLERAMEEGFNNRKRILEDPDIQKISKDPAFIALMKNPPVAIRE